MHDVISPITEQVIATVPSLSADEADEAIARAREALPAWREVAPGDRAGLLRAFSDVVRDHVEELAQLEVANSGHTISNGRWEANNVAKALDEGEAEMGFYDGDGLELDDVLREFVLLALPMQKLCTENCKGICPVCGQNRNEIECRCQSTVGDDRWAALKEIRKNAES